MYASIYECVCVCVCVCQSVMEVANGLTVEDVWRLARIILHQSHVQQFAISDAGVHASFPYGTKAGVSLLMNAQVRI